MKNITIYTDGACSGNPGPGGWAAILLYKDINKEISGGKPFTTNNEMELTAVVEALSCLKEPCYVQLFSDSSYVVNAIQKDWLSTWKSKGWINSQKKTLPNLALWKELDRLINIHNIEFNWVKGHADNKFNNRCDELAVIERNKYIG